MSEDKIYKIPVDVLQNFMQDVFIAMGIVPDEAKMCAEILIAADVSGIESHGIGRLKYYYERIKAGQIQPETHFEIVKESPTTAVIDGHHSMGMPVARHSMEMAIDKARIYGMGAVAVRNSNHFGIDGYYARMAVNAGMIGMSFTNARPSIAPTFGVEPMMGTNPIAFGAPTDEEFPFLFDAATSITQRGKIEVAALKEKPIPAGWVINSQGQTETDSVKILRDLVSGEAALLSLGGEGESLAGYKGYGLAAMVEILSASLQSGAFLSALSGLDASGNKCNFNVGHFFMAINIENFVDLDTFKKTTGDIIRELRHSQKAPGCSRIYTAGEKEFENSRRIHQEGVTIVPNLQKEILFLKKVLNLYQYHFPFQEQ